MKDVQKHLPLDITRCRLLDLLQNNTQPVIDVSNMHQNRRYTFSFQTSCLLLCIKKQLVFSPILLGT